MKVIHGTWIPDADPNYIQPGSFYLWVETSFDAKHNSKSQQQIHPTHLSKDELGTFLNQELGIKDSAATIQQRISPQYFALPTANARPIPSPELTKYLEAEISEEYDGFEYWQISCYRTVTTVKTSFD